MSRGAVTGVVYPGLPDHPSHHASAGLAFGGALLHLSFRTGEDSADLHRSIVENMLEEAARAGTPLCAGASFGFDVTRVYRTASGTESNAFVRIAPGIEDLAGIEELGRALAAACARI